MTPNTVLFVLLAAAAHSWTAGASQWYRPAGCLTECDLRHQCVSGECHEQWDACEPGFTETRREAMPDQLSCYDNGCDWGGCDKPGYVEVSKKPCVNLKHACVGCMQETCCRVRDKVTCCRRLNCTEDLENCRVPQQRALGPNNSSRSDIYYTTIASGGSATFPYYLQTTVPSNSSCDAVRVWGSCTCEDGQSQPGCLFNDSSSWLDIASDSGARLPPRLSITCIRIPPPLPPGEPPVTDQAGQPHSGNGRNEGRLSGGKIAGVVVVAVLGSVLLVGAAFSAFRMLRDAGALPQRRRGDAGGAGGALPTGGSSYSPVFTGQSYTPGLVRPKLTLPPQIRRLVSYWRTQLSRLQGDVTEEAVAAYQQHRAALGARLASKYPSTGPALPEDVEDEELYTLEDIETDTPRRAAQRARAPRAHPELEMGLVSDPLLSPRVSAPGHPYDFPARAQSGAGEPQVIHTTAVYLGHPLAQPLTVASDGLRPGHQPLTPQPTGHTNVQYQAHRTG